MCFPLYSKTLHKFYLCFLEKQIIRIEISVFSNWVIFFFLYGLAYFPFGIINYFLVYC